MPQEREPKRKKISRREFLRATGIAFAGLLTAACAPQQSIFDARVQVAQAAAPEVEKRQESEKVAPKITGFRFADGSSYGRGDLPVNAPVPWDDTAILNYPVIASYDPEMEYYVTEVETKPGKTIKNLKLDDRFTVAYENGQTQDYVVAYTFTFRVKYSRDQFSPVIYNSQEYSLEAFWDFVGRINDIDNKERLLFQTCYPTEDDRTVVVTQPVK